MKTKKARQKINSKKSDKSQTAYSKIIFAVIGIILFLYLAYLLIPKESQQWSVSEDGILSYPENREKVDVNVLKTESGDNYTLETISFQSKDYNVEGLFRIPASNRKVPAVVILPGATVTKEGTQGLAEIFSNLGYASLGIEQRNRGGVDFRYDYELFRAGNEPTVQMLYFCSAL